MCTPDAIGQSSCGPTKHVEPLVIAHRGSTAEYPENTLAAFAWARELGADMVELDVRFSADGHAVVIHDATVDRTTNGHGRVGKMTLTELQALNVGSKRGIPTFDAALTFAEQTRTSMLIDVKIDAINVGRIVEAIRSYRLESQITIGVRSVAALREVRQANAALTTLALTPNQNLIGAFLDEGVDIVRLWARWLGQQPQLVDDIHAASACVWVTTGGLRGNKLSRIISQGVAGLITDHPSEALQLRRALYPP